MSFKIHMPSHLLMDRQLIGDRVKRLRLAAGWSQTELANRAGVSRNTIVRMETSTQGLPIDAYLVVADALGVPAWRLFRDEDE
ncbi:helix-turn-helix domain-containing protein [Kitasatospora cineracea]|uniref:helix-turn-helix domain-containing protein n=1 Tax=Kitasatospora cineracea TaxID=88074 RepID=UPI0036C2F7B4